MLQYTNILEIYLNTRYTNGVGIKVIKLNSKSRNSCSFQKTTEIEKLLSRKEREIGVEKNEGGGGITDTLVTALFF